MTNEELDAAGIQMKYFVVKPSGKDEYGAASRRALSAYANGIRDVNPQLACELDGWVIKCMDDLGIDESVGGK